MTPFLLCVLLLLMFALMNSVTSRPAKVPSKTNKYLAAELARSSGLRLK